MAALSTSLPAVGGASPGLRWALLAGNFAIGCGVMVVAGSLNDLVRSLQVSVPAGGQLITVAALVMALGAPLVAAAVGGWDRRRLLVLALAWYAVGHAASALAQDFTTLLPLRAISVLGAAVFTPQAAAALSVMTAPADRARAITFVFLGWSLASVLGMPLHSFIGETFGWRWAFALVALLSAGAAVWVWRTMPDGVKPPAMSLADWGRTLTHPLLMGMVLVTVLSAAGQFSLFSYLAPYYRQVLGADAASVSFLFMWFGAFGLIGNLLLSRAIDRIGVAHCVTLLLAGIAVSMLVWPLAGAVWSMALVMVPWAFGCFASNSAQQARLGLAAPALAAALMALNTSAMYLGQAIGAASGGALMLRTGFDQLHWAALAWLLLAIGLSAGLAWRMRAAPHV
jgi:predicted MFS family arabinose efflux permease